MGVVQTTVLSSVDQIRIVICCVFPFAYKTVLVKCDVFLDFFHVS